MFDTNPNVSLTRTNVSYIEVIFGIRAILYIEGALTRMKPICFAYVVFIAESVKVLSLFIGRASLARENETGGRKSIFSMLTYRTVLIFVVIIELFQSNYFSYTVRMIIYTLTYGHMKNMDFLHPTAPT